MGCGVAAFFDVDGTLARCTVVHPYLWYAAHQAIPSRSIARVARTIAHIPFYWALDQLNRETFNRFFYREYAGISRNRLLTLAEEMFIATVKPRLYSGAIELIRRTQDANSIPVFVTGALDFTVAPLAALLDVEHVIANQLVFADGTATGELVQPCVVTRTKAARMQQFAEAHDIDLQASFAYADSISDLPMLTAVGRPTAVQTDRRLTQMATTRRWPVIQWGPNGQAAQRR